MNCLCVGSCVFCIVHMCVVQLVCWTNSPLQQLAQPIRLLLKYNGLEFDNVLYEQGDGEMSILQYVIHYIVIPM